MFLGSGRPRARVFLPYIKCISVKISVQAIGYTDRLQLQKYLQEIPHRSERKTRG